MQPPFAAAEGYAAGSRCVPAIGACALGRIGGSCAIDCRAFHFTVHTRKVHAFDACIALPLPRNAVMTSRKRLVREPPAPCTWPPTGRRGRGARGCGS